jgi:putative MATE family efflux protein
MSADKSARRELGRTLFETTWPMIFGVLALLGTQLVDAAFIGQLGVRPLAALGFTLPVMQFVIGTQVGIGIATTALISRAIGAGDEVRARRLGGLVIGFGAVVMFALCVLIWTLRGPVLALLGADPELIPLVERYWVPWLFSAWAGAMLYFGYSVCRAHGSMRLPGMVMVGSSLANLALDPLFIFVFGWGLPGAALATTVAFALGMAVVYPRLLANDWLRFDLGRLPPGPALGALGGIAGPAMISQLMPSVSAMLATALVSGFGATAVAAWGLGLRLEFFSIVAVLGLTMSLPPMVGRLLGAGDLASIRRLVRIALRFVLLWQLAVALLWLATSGVLSRLLSQDGTVAALLQDYLVMVPLSYGPLGVCMVLVSVCNALGLPLRAMLISGVRLFGCYLPLLWLGGRLAGLDGVFAGALAGNVAAGLAAYALYRRAIRRLQRDRAASGEAELDSLDPRSSPG